MKEYMPGITSKLPIEVIDITANSLHFLKINANFPDCSIILYPMVRTLEHVMRSILENYNYPYTRKGFEMFGTERDKTCTLVRNNNCKMDDNCSVKLGKCYTFYKTHRHLIMHLSDDVTEIRVIPREVAVELTMECMDLIEDVGSEFY